MSETKVESGRCDFCQINEAAKSINGGLWWLCVPCLDLEFGTRSKGGEEE